MDHVDPPTIERLMRLLEAPGVRKSVAPPSGFNLGAEGGGIDGEPRCLAERQGC